MTPIANETIETIRQLRRNGMTVRDIEAKCGVSRQTVQKYTTGSFDAHVGHAYKAPKVERHTVSRVMPNGTRRSVTADTRDQAEKVCNWQLVGNVAKRIAEGVAKNRFVDGGAHAMKRNGPGGADNTDPTLNRN